jgi:hypothetical protein
MGRTEFLTRSDYERALGWISNSIESEMALFSECRLKCAQNTLDIADIVREGIYSNRYPCLDHRDCVFDVRHFARSQTSLLV